MPNRFVFSAVLATLFMMFVWQSKVMAEEHPFLIVKETEYGELQALALQSPWREMKASAIRNATGVSYNAASPYADKCRALSQIVSSNALAFILDPARQDIYKQNILKALNNWDDLYAGLYGGQNSDWTESVPPGSAFFNSVLALDIIHNSLTPAELDAAESMLGKVAQWYWTHDGPHMINIWAVRGVWSLYKGEARFADAKAGYRSHLMRDLTSDGVYTPGPLYASSRFGDLNQRDAKQHFMDVLEFTGNDSYYTDPKVRNFYEWLHGYSATPFKRHFIFGDSAATKTSITFSSASYRAYRFSDQAARYAAWNVQGTTPEGLLLTFVLMRKPLPPPEAPKSRIFTDGGAWFYQNSSSSNSLAGALWNPQSQGDGHAHKEVNAINLVGYGEYLLRNAGYKSWGAGTLGFPWDYFNNRAVSGNTVLINYNFENNYSPPAVNDHASKIGAGIKEGILTQGFDYASGDSGFALPNGKHIRNLIFVHPQDAKNGYWVIFDEVKAKGAGETAHVALHPNSAAYSTISANREYQWTINKYSGHDVFLTVFLGTPPRLSEIKDGAFGNGGGTSFVGKYLFSTYETGSDGKRNIVTVMFPHDATHARASLTRIVGDGYTGARIDQGGSTVDVALESSGTSTATYDGVSFKGLATLYRLNNGAVAFHFVRQGRSFIEGATERKGFDSDRDVSLFLKGNEGKIISPGTDVTFYYPDITGVLLNGRPAAQLDSGKGWVRINVAAGNYDLKFLTTPNQAPTALAVASPGSGFAPLDVVFDGSGSSDSDGAINDYKWDFGDGTTSSGARANHTYSVVGTFTAKLSVTDDFGATSTSVTTITVSSAPPPSPTPTPTPEPTPLPSPSPSPLPACVPVTSGLVSQYLAEENAFDTNGTNDGMLLNGVGFVDGKAGQAFSFDGGGAAVMLPASGLRDAYSALTIDAWVYPLSHGADTAYGGGYGRTLISNTNTDGFALRVINGYVQADLRLTGGNVLHTFGQAQLSLAAWSHVALTYDGSQVSAYLNGQLLGSKAASGVVRNAQNAGTYAMVGNEPDGPAVQAGGFGWHGHIDDLEIFNRALSAQEIQSIYDRGAGACQMTTISP